MTLKHNLTNRPTLKYPCLEARQEGLEDYYQNCEKWFQGIKEELEQLKQETETDVARISGYVKIDEVLGT